MTKNPKLFREMSEPLADRETANKAAEAFFDDVRAAREKHHLKNVAVIGEMVYMADGEECNVFALSMIGDQMAAEPMFAYGYGAMKADRDAYIAKLIRSASK